MHRWMHLRRQTGASLHAVRARSRYLLLASSMCRRYFLLLSASGSGRRAARAFNDAWTAIAAPEGENREKCSRSEEKRKRDKERRTIGTSRCSEACRIIPPRLSKCFVLFRRQMLGTRLSPVTMLGLSALRIIVPISDHALTVPERSARTCRHWTSSRRAIYLVLHFLSRD